MRIISTTDKEFEREFRRILGRGGVMAEEVVQTVAAICEEVEKRGDEALFAYTERYDGVRLTPEMALVSPDEIERAMANVSAEDMEMLKLAAERIERFHRHQVVSDWRYEEAGLVLGQKVVPLARVGIYCPGGRAAYPSTVLMAAIPAAIAGVGEIIMASPSSRGEINPLVIAAAQICGISRIFKVGGAQAVAAMAYGTETIPAVDKIVGPGNAYVAAAKRLVYGRVSIDMIAGPSECLIVSDGRVNPAFVASDLLAQAEHDEQAAAILVTPDMGFAREVAKEVERQMKALERKSICRQAIDSYGVSIITRDLTEAMEVANRFAPEHLEIATKDPEKLLPLVRNAGAVFLGPYTPETMGDYLAGPNHILPTGGTARFSSALGVYDFFKRISVISISEPALRKLGPFARRFAQREGLTAHGKAIDLRLAGKGEKS
ncbi:MAG TPA: histidinol dehydrogenase [Syntrophales bacterium]|nr:histidinol dehydrogenase [Syntrophales bacterium]HOL59876.1 histidinol dehydrogenase [Syntrophales bacterium]HPO36023.1 histidinol dehydrogenase [Syntrophales bacterium]